MSDADRFGDLDARLTTSDPDSMDWADGGGREAAEAILGGFSGINWVRLAAEWRNRGQNWRVCLAQILCPGQGASAADVLLEVVFDPVEEVAFEALRQVAFYCGVNASARGPFLDARILDRSFLERARREERLRARIDEVGAYCSEWFQEQLRLLDDVLAGEA